MGFPSPLIHGSRLLLKPQIKKLKGDKHMNELNEASSKLTGFVETAIEMSMMYLPKVVLAIVVLAVGLWVVKKIVRGFEHVLKKRGMDETLVPFLSGVLGTLLKIMLVISVVSMVGVATTSFIAVLGAVGFALGMAMQGTLGNFASSVLLMVFKPYQVGDYVVAQDVEGVVERIDVFTTVLNSLDNKKIMVPNGQMTSGTISNFSANEVRRVDVAVGIGYSDSVDVARQALVKMAEADSRVLSEPGRPFVGLVSFGDSALDLTFRVWTKTENYWDVYFDMHEKTKKVLDEAGVNIPFPQRDVHMINKA